MARSDRLAPSQGTATTPDADGLLAPKKFGFLNKRHTLYLKNFRRWSLRWQLAFGDVESDLGKRRFLPQGTGEDAEFYNCRIKLSEIIPESPPVVRRVVNKVFGEEITRDWKNNEDLSILETNMDGRNTRADKFMRTVARKAAVMGVYHVLTDKPAMPAGAVAQTLQDEKDLGIRVPMFVTYSPLEVVNWSTDRTGNLLWALIKIVRHDMDEESMEPVTVVEFTKWTRADWRRWTFHAAKGKDGKESGQLVPVGDKPGEPVPHPIGRVPLTQVYLEFVETMVGEGLSEEAFRADLLKIRAESNLTWDAYVHAHPQLFVWAKRDLADIGVGSNTIVKLNPEADEDARYLSPEGNAFEQNIAIIERAGETVVRHQGVDPLGLITGKRNVQGVSGASRAWSFKTSEEQTIHNLATSLQSGEEMMFEDASRLLESPLKDRHPFDARIFVESNGGSIRYPKKFDITSPQERMEQFIQAKRHIKSQTLLRELAMALGLAYTMDLPPEKIKVVSKEIEAIDFTKEGQFEPGGPPPFEEDEE